MTGGGVLTEAGGDGLDPANQKFTGEIMKVAVLSAIGGFLFGYDTGIVSGAMIYIKDDMKLNDVWQEAVISITIAGAWIFSMLAGWTADAFGRKMVVYLASAVFVVGALMMGSANGPVMLLLGRFIVGAGIGFASMVVPMYIAEMAPSQVRGSLVTMNNLFIAGGQAFAAVLAAILGPAMDPTVGWRWMLGLAAIPAIIQFVGFLFMPESPRWLIQKNRDFQAMEVLQRIRGPDADIEPEYEFMKENCKEIEGGEGKSCMTIMQQIMADPPLRKALLVGCMLQTVQQLTGINTVMYYAATIIQMSGVYDKGVAVWMAALTAVINFLFNFPGIYLVEKIGRKMLTLGSLAGVIFSLGLLAVGFELGQMHAPDITMFTNSSIDANCSIFDTCTGCISSDACGYCFLDGNYSQEGPKKYQGSCLQVQLNDSMAGSIDGECYDGTTLGSGSSPAQVWAKNWCPSNYSWLTLVGLSSYLLFFAPGMGPMPWTINSEIYPLWARSVCFSTATSFNWLFNFIVSATFLSLAKLITRHGAFWLYGGFGAAGFVFFWFFLPETKGVSIEETLELFGGKKKSKRVSSLQEHARNDKSA